MCLVCVSIGYRKMVDKEQSIFGRLSFTHTGKLNTMPCNRALQCHRSKGRLLKRVRVKNNPSPERK